MYEGTIPMADDVMIKGELSNPCCIAWKEKYGKLKESYTKLEDRRNALRKGLSIYEEQVSKIQSENLSLKKAVEDEKVRANNEKEEKVKESAVRFSLESEVTGLKNEILTLKQKLMANDGCKEIGELKDRLSERETKVNELNGLVEKERIRAESEKKKAELEKKKTDELSTKLKGEKRRADEERRLADVEKKRAEGHRLNLENLKKEADQVKSKVASITLEFEDAKKQLEAEKANRSRETNLKKEADQVKSKLASVTLEFEDAKKQLEAEKANIARERKRADAAVAKAAEQKKIAEANRQMAMDEKSRANNLSRQLEQDRQKVDNLKKEIGELMSSGKMACVVRQEGTPLGTAKFLPERGAGAEQRDVTMLDVTLNTDKTKKRLQEMEQKVVIEKKRVNSEMKKVDKQRLLAEAYKKKASEEKDRADKLFEEVKNYKKKVEELQKEIEKLTFARSFVDCPLHAHDNSVHVENAEVKLLKKQLKLEKKLLKHAKKVAKFKETRNRMLQQNLLSLKQELVHFARRLNVLDGCFFQGDKHDLGKADNFNLKSNYSSLEPCEMHCHFGNDFVQLAAVGSDQSKQKIECNVPLLPICGGNNPGSISGINSKLEPLIRGSTKKVLQSSGINSSSASFSDRLLVGSQERCASITTSAKSAEGKLDIGPTLSSLSGDVRKSCNENVVTIAESNVKSPISCMSMERSASRQKKTRRFLDTIESNGNLSSGGNKRQKRLAENTSGHDGMLNTGTDGPPDEKKHLEANIQHNACRKHFKSRNKRKTSCGLGLHPLSSNSVARTKFGTSCVESDVFKRPSPTVDILPETAQDWKDGKSDDVGDINELAGCDYMKLLNLDNDIDEESYRLAIERPLSPTLPDIQCRSSVALESINSPSHEEFSNAMGILASSGSSDVINVEINSNRLKHCILDPAKNSLLPDKRDHIDSSMRLNHDTAGNYSSEELCRSDLAATASEELQISREGRVISLSDYFAKYCVIFSNTDEEISISSVYRATSRCLAQQSASSDRSLGSILVTLLNFEEISDKEKTCALFSLLLLYISDSTTRDFGDDCDRDLIPFINSVARHTYTELSHENVRRIFVKFCNLYDVLALMEDFLLHGKLLVRAVSSDPKLATNSGINLIMDGHCISLCKQPASTMLLLTGGILLASLCTAVDHVAFVCEASCNILRVLRYDALNILHIFAYLCGSKYYALKEHGLAMTVMKSVVMLVHKNDSSPNPLSSVGSSVQSSSKICSGNLCPFLKGAVTMDIVASLLLDSLRSCACSAVVPGLMESLNSSSCGGECDGRKTGKVSEQVDVVQPAFVTSGNSCQLIDTLALVELVAGFMSWDWMFDKIACPLLNLLESCPAEHFAAAITTLLGQLGRSMLQDFGGEDVRIQRLRSSLCGLLCDCASKGMGLHFQFSIAIALIGLIPLSIEELTESNIGDAKAANPCDPADCLKKWFALLCSEQRVVFKLVNSSSLSSRRT